MSATRLLIPLYALACPNNFLHSEPNYKLAATLLAWVGLQVGVLVIQVRGRVDEGMWGGRRGDMREWMGAYRHHWCGA